MGEWVGSTPPHSLLFYAEILLHPAYLYKVEDIQSSMSSFFSFYIFLIPPLIWRKRSVI
jgi:hypothetical protein